MVVVVVTFFFAGISVFGNIVPNFWISLHAGDFSTDWYDCITEYSIVPMNLLRGKDVFFCQTNHQKISSSAAATNRHVCNNAISPLKKCYCTAI